MKIHSPAKTFFHLLLLLAALILLLPFKASAQENSKIPANAAEHTSPEQAAPSEQPFNWGNSWNLAILVTFNGREPQIRVPEPEKFLDLVLIVGINKESLAVQTKLIPVDQTLTSTAGGEAVNLAELYSRGSYETVFQMLDTATGIQFDDYLFLDWNAVINTINILNGVEVEISEEEYFYINAFITETVKLTGIPSTIIRQAGTNYFDGVQLVSYSRLMLSENDPKRADRQLKALSLAWNKVMKADFLSMYRVFQVMISQVNTSIDADDMRFLLEYGMNEGIRGGN